MNLLLQANEVFELPRLRVTSARQPCSLQAEAFCQGCGKFATPLG